MIGIGLKPSKSALFLHFIIATLGQVDRDRGACQRYAPAIDTNGQVFQ
ncbi:MAG: hypothetical protein ACRDBL_08055 [Rhabdaerophilum sp.]